MNKLLFGSLMVLSSFSIQGETWKCVTENEQKIYSDSVFIRVGNYFETYNNGSLIGKDEIIMENEKEIILYFKDQTQSYITILEKKYKTLITYGSTGKDPNKDLPPGFGNCEIVQ